MVSLLSLIGVIVCIYGVVTETISFGIVFIISLIIFLYALLSMLNRGMRLTEFGITISVASLVLLLYTVCYLFLNIDIRVILGI